MRKVFRKEAWLQQAGKYPEDPGKCSPATSAAILISAILSSLRNTMDREPLQLSYQKK